MVMTLRLKIFTQVANTYVLYTTCLMLCQTLWSINQVPALKKHMQLGRGGHHTDMLGWNPVLLCIVFH